MNSMEIAKNVSTYFGIIQNSECSRDGGRQTAQNALFLQSRAENVAMGLKKSRKDEFQPEK